MAKIIDGKAISKDIREEIKNEVAERIANGLCRPGLAVIIVGNDPASRVYVNNKKKACEACSIKSLEYALDENTSEEELLALDKGEAVALSFENDKLYCATDENLYVYDAYTTKNESSASQGAMTLYCQAGNERIAVRTIVLYDENGELVTQDRFLGKTIDVKGLVDYFDGKYQIKVFTVNQITVK